MSATDNLVSQVLYEFLEIAIHNILYYRKVYPANIFEKRRKYGIQVFKSVHPTLNEYIQQSLKAVEFHAAAQALRRVFVCIISNQNIIEKYVFEITNFQENVQDDPMLLKLADFFRNFCLKLNSLSSYTNELPDDAEFIIKIHIKKSSLVAFNENSTYSDFPWIEIDAIEHESDQIMPLISLDSNNLGFLKSANGNNRKGRLAVFEQVSNPDKGRGVKRRLPNIVRGPLDSELAADDDYEDDNLMIVSKTSRRSRRGIRFVDEPLNLSCSWKHCNFKATNYNKFSEHVIGHRELEDLDMDELQCYWDNCKFLATSDQFYKKHLGFHAYHSKLKNIGENVVSRGKLPSCHDTDYYRVPGLIVDYHCEWGECHRLFKTLDEFLMHVKMHVNGNTKICKKGEFIYCEWSGCSSKFVTQYKLSDHVRVHTKEKVVACPTCGNMFATKTKFSDHRKRQMAPELQTYQCSQCSKLFATEPLLREHIRSHINHYKCTMCDMTSPTPSTLAKHIRFRHISDRPFKCTKCNHASVTKINMDIHMTTHIEEKLMECDECDFTCRSMYGLERHFIKYHGDGNMKNYECHICESRFSRGNNLTRHLMRKHEYSWPSGHSRFRYKEDSEGIFRLQTVRYESLEVTQEMMNKSRSITANSSNSNAVTYNLEKLETTNNDCTTKPQHSFVLMVSESGENIVCPTDKNIVITVDDVDENGRFVKSETVCSREIVTGSDNGLLSNSVSPESD